MWSYYFILFQKGLSCGFCLTTDIILKSNPTESLYNNVYQDEMFNLSIICNDLGIKNKDNLENHKKKILEKKFTVK